MSGRSGAPLQALSKGLSALLRLTSFTPAGILDTACNFPGHKRCMGGSTKSQKAGRIKRLEAKIVKKPASYRDYVETIQ